MQANSEYVLCYNHDSWYNRGFFLLVFPNDKTMTINMETIDAVFFCYMQPMKIIGEWTNLTSTKTYKFKSIGG